MGESRENDLDPVAEWDAMVEAAETHDELDALGRALKAGGPPPSGRPDRATAPVIVDTDLGGDPDDAFAVAVAALTVPELALVVTSDEYQGRRARFARYFLDLLGRADVPVVRGIDLGNTRYFCVEGLTPAGVPDQPGDVVAAVATVCAATRGPVRWVGLGPASNLSALFTQRPDLAERLAITQMGGALAYRDPTRAEHNFRLDPAAARHLLQAAKRPTLVVSDVTFSPELEITAESPVATGLAAADAPAWARVLRAHLDAWVAGFHPGSMQHDGVTLAAALLWPGVRFARERVVLDDQARMSRSADGVEIRMSVSCAYADFLDWFTNRLGATQRTG